MSILGKTILAVGLFVAGASGCTGTIENIDPTVGDSASGRSRAEIDVARTAIFAGLDVGKTSIVTSVNRVLSENVLGVSFSEGTLLEAPSLPAAEACPYLEATATDSSLNCRFVVERARDLAYTDMGPALDEGPSVLALQKELDQEWVQIWYQSGAFSGVDGEVVRAVAELRRLGACDTAPTPAENSEMAGYEVGRDLFLQTLAAQIAVTPRTVCDFDSGIIEPALNTAVARMSQTVANNPLCGNFVPTAADEVFAFDRAKLAYELGVRAGIRDQAVISSQTLLSTWVCTPPVTVTNEGGGGDGGGAGDPLVIDLDGNGIAPFTFAHNVRFDLTGGGIAAHTAWPAAGDALLGMDIDGSGTLDNGRELFSNYMVGPGSSRFGTGFEALAVYDRKALGGNDDGVLSAADEAYAKVLVWNDANHNGVSEPSELTTLAAVGLDSLALSPTPLGRIAHGDAWMTETTGVVTEVWVKQRY